MSSSAAALDIPPNQDWFSFRLTDDKLIEFYHSHKRNIIINQPPPVSLLMYSYLYVKLYVHDVTRMYYIDEHDGTKQTNDEAFTDSVTHQYVGYNEDENSSSNTSTDDVQNSLASILHDIAKLPQEALAASSPILLSFARGVTPVTVNGSIVRPFVLDVRFVNEEYYDQENNLVDRTEFESLVPTPSEEEENGYVDALEKGFDVTGFPCSHVYHEGCDYFMAKQSCSM